MVQEEDDDEGDNKTEAHVTLILHHPEWMNLTKCFSTQYHGDISADLKGGSACFVGAAAAGLVRPG